MSGSLNEGGDTDPLEVRLSEQQIEHAERLCLDRLSERQERVSRFARPHERKDVGRRINPETAYVFFLYAQVLDPYGDGGLPEEAYCVGRMYFAVDPEEGVAVSFLDLPEATWEALDGKQKKADREGWERLLGGRRFEPDRQARNELPRAGEEAD